MSNIILGIALVLCFATLSTGGELDTTDDEYVYAKYLKKTYKRMYTKKGCFPLDKEKEENGHVLFSWKDNIKWKSIDEFAKRLVCACADAAKARNVKNFAIHCYSECWLIKKHSVKMVDNACMLADGKNMTTCNANNLDDAHECLGGTSGFYVYNVAPEISCDFKNGKGSGGVTRRQEDMSPNLCVAHCIQKREKDSSINGVMIDNKGDNKCYCGSKMKSILHNPKWQSCILKVESPKVKFTSKQTTGIVGGGKACSADTPCGNGEGICAVDTHCKRGLKCGYNNCNIKMLSIVSKYNCCYKGPGQVKAVVDGSFGAWSAWSKCTKTCGSGMKTRGRQCDNPKPKNGGNYCVGDLGESATCNSQHCPVDGIYGPWSPWTECTHTCGGGNQLRMRHCDSPEPAYGGKTCVGLDEENAPCNYQNCPVDGKYGLWSPWTECTHTCGGGNRLRNRHCDNPAPAYGGKKCVGLDAEDGPCNSQKCPINGKFGDWTKWTKCTKKCGGGAKYRSHQCNNPKPAYGGKDCVGLLTKSETCNSHSCPINGKFGEWSKWTTCSKKCGGGKQSRKRYCNNPKPQHGGKGCDGMESELLACSSQNCPINGGEGKWSKWSDCTKKCGGGKKARTRECNKPKPAYGGKNCVEQLAESKTCNSQVCPVDGKFGGWTQWTTCTKTCGGGRKSRKRHCNNPKPANGGKDCDGKTTISETCNIQSCPIDGKFGEWSKWTECSKKCGGGEKYRKRHCDNPKPKHGGKGCDGDLAEKENCNPHSCPEKQIEPTQMEAVGCFNQYTLNLSPATYNQLLANDRSLIIWNDKEKFKSYVKTLLNKCAHLAVKGGYKYFAIVFWGECWGVKDVKNGKTSTDCKKGDATWKTCDGSKEENCLGVTHVAFVYTVVKRVKVDGGLGPWTAWTNCSKKCGGGDRLRTRKCDHPKPENGGKGCDGMLAKLQTCNSHSCPINGRYGGWSVWSGCSKKCGGGYKRRNRQCNNPAPEFGGKRCTGIGTEATTCNKQACPVDGKFGEWSKWTNCTKKCGGGKTWRMRHCDSPKPAHGGKKCDGHYSESKICNSHGCAVDGKLSKWSKWTACTKKCGGGKKTRSRKCNNPAPAYGGKGCVGLLAERGSCNLQGCPVDGGFGRWSKWSHCDKRCGGGTRKRTRKCNNPKPAHGGKKCDGMDAENEACNSQNCPINGGVGPWSPWTKCSKKCGGGKQSRTRQCDDPKSAYGGKKCVEQLAESKFCNSQACPVDGKFGEWTSWSDCDKKCGGGEKRRKRQCNNPAPSNGGKECDGMLAETSICNSESCPVNGGFGEWSGWSRCNKKCGGGRQSRTRKCNNPKPAHGGKGCDGMLAAGKTCNHHSCPDVTNYVIVGCWKDKQQHAIASLEGTDKVLIGYYKDRSDAVKKCYLAAKAQGYRYFAVQDGGACYSSATAGETYQKYGPSNACKPDGEGGPDANQVYKIKVKVDGGFGPWSKWTTCSKKCGGGEATRRRKCDNPKPEDGGKPCNGMYGQRQTCNSHSCPVDGKFGKWSNWSSCSKKCGGGKRTRDRQCDKPKPAHGGKDCVGYRGEIIDCNEHSCPVDGKFGDWSKWTKCTKKCGGGKQTRRRYCNNPKPAHGGKKCDGANSERQSCNKQYCPVDGEFGKWSKWTKCTKQCGGGEHSRTRKCDDPKPKHGGKDCVGLLSEQQTCNARNCPIDGEFGNWSKWSDCTKKCGGGTQLRSRHCDNPRPAYGGKNCVGRISEAGSCNSQNCPVDGGVGKWSKWSDCNKKCGGEKQTRTRKCDNPKPKYEGKECVEQLAESKSCHTRSCPVNGGLGDWSKWSKCNKKCGYGHQTRTRKCDNPKPQHGGKECDGKLSDSHKCNSFNCPVDGGLGKWSKWTDCTKKCGGGTQSRKRHCDKPKPQYAGKGCNGNLAEKVYCNSKSCLFVGRLSGKVNGEFGPWSPWTECSKQCGGGKITRNRQCDDPKPENGGKHCEGMVEVEKTCNSQRCPVDGEVGEWTRWTSCTEKCGGGSRMYTRNCDNPAPANGGRACAKPLVQSESCNTDNCPIDGGFRKWSKWSECDKTCGYGHKKRTRKCDNPKPAHGGKKCDGKVEQLEKCNSFHCPVDGKVGKWKKWTKCNRKCGGGKQTRSRKCNKPAPAYGGKECGGLLAEQRTCNAKGCPVDGGLGKWSKWTNCTKKCGGGEKLRKRKCNDPKPDNGGKDCDGNLKERLSCNSQNCPVDGGVGKWSEWSGCTKKCGGGKQLRYRECDKPKPEFRGKDCVESLTESKRCNSQKCPKVSNATEPVNGGFGEWTGWSKCSRKCGGGERIRTRKCDNPKPTNGGKWCKGLLSEDETCNSQKCPIDGGLGKWSAWTTCDKDCGGGEKSRSRQCNNPPRAYGGKGCVGLLEENKACHSHNCPIDGGLGEWSTWSGCNKKCGGGTRNRRRKCNKPSPAYGGKECPGMLLEGVACNSQICPISLPKPQNNIYVNVNPNTIEIKQTTLVTTIPVFWKVYTISFDVNPSKFINNVTNVLHLSPENIKNPHISRMPAVYFHPVSPGVGRLVVCTRVSGVNNHCFVSKHPYSGGKWIPVKITQEQINSGYYYRVYLNGTKVYEKINNRPEEFHNVKVYTGAPWWQAQPGHIRNLIIKALPKYTSVGCWQDKAPLAIPTLEGTDDINLKGQYQNRRDAIGKCYQAAKYRGFSYFAVQNGGLCFSSATAGITYKKYGSSKICNANGKGGTWANEVYKINGPPKYHNIGCWQDKARRTIPSLEGTDNFNLNGKYQSRSDAIEKCYHAAKARGFRVFAVQNGGLCVSSAYAGMRYGRYGISKACKSNGKGGTWANEVYKILAPPKYNSIGCWQDKADRAIPSLEGTDDFNLKGKYQSRPDAIENCYHAAKARGFRVFAVQNGGLCVSSVNAGKTYHKYGISKICKSHGKGGTWANEVYTIHTPPKYNSIGCWQDKADRAIPSLEGTDDFNLKGKYQSRPDAIENCYHAAKARGFRVFALQNGGLCVSSVNAGKTYLKYGQSKVCKSDGKGGAWSSEVYTIHAPPEYNSISCWQDKSERAIPSLEGTDQIYLDGKYQSRPEAVARCYYAAKSRGFRVFAVQNGGLCVSSATAGRTYKKYGTSKVCRSNGKGGIWANEVYTIRAPAEYNSIGCWQDRAERAIPSLEGSDKFNLNGKYQSRLEAIARCYYAAKSRGFRVFAVQNGGLCVSSATAEITYRKYGPSKGCKSDGKGGTWANEVYKINVPPLGLFIYPNEMKIRKTRRLTTMPVFGKEYTISFDVFPSRFIKTLANVIHLTVENNTMPYGSRIPAVYIQSATAGIGRIVVCTGIGGISNNCYYSRAPYFSPGTWIPVKIAQEQTNSSYYYRVYLNGTKVYEKMNNIPREFTNVQVYSGAPWCNAQPGNIRHLIINAAPPENGAYTYPGLRIIRQNELLANMPTIGKEYTISFDISPSNFTKKMANVIHLSTGNNWSRIPAVNFKSVQPGTGCLCLCTGAVETTKQCLHSKPPYFKTDRWSSVKIAQERMNSGYYYKVYVNGVKVHSLVNKAPREFSNVNIYSGSPWCQAQQGHIRNLIIKG